MWALARVQSIAYTLKCKYNFAQTGFIDCDTGYYLYHLSSRLYSSCFSSSVLDASTDCAHWICILLEGFSWIQFSFFFGLISGDRSDYRWQKWCGDQWLLSIYSFLAIRCWWLRPRKIKRSRKGLIYSQVMYIDCPQKERTHTYPKLSAWIGFSPSFSIDRTGRLRLLRIKCEKLHWFLPTRCIRKSTNARHFITIPRLRDWCPERSFLLSGGRRTKLGEDFAYEIGEHF